YTTDGSQFISDFQRFDVATGDTLAEDLRYSRRFERFFWQPNEEGIVTLSGTEWRLWSVATGELIRREVLPLNGSIVATSPDGFSYLTRFNNVSGQTGMETYDVGTGERQNVLFQDLQGRFIEDILPSADWQHFLVIYSVNEWGPYAPGNEIALYSLTNGPVWFFAGDDLPEPDSRSYGWVDNERVYVNGARSLTGEFIQPPRELIAAMPPLDSLTPDALPACFSEVYTPEQQSTLMLYWPLLFETAPRDEISYAVGAACTSRADSVYRNIVSAFEQIPSQEGPAPTATLSAEYINGVPACLLTRYPDRVDTLAGDWARLTAELPSDLEVTLAGLMCRGLADLPARQTESFGLQTMMIDTNTGERFEGRFASNPVIRRPIEPILDEFYRTEERSMGTALLSPSEQFVAASSQPGELIVYRILRPYQTLLDQITATAIAVIATENRIAVLPSATPTLSMIGTANPTLTPTISPTPPPRPETLVDQPQLNDVQDFCPSETLYSIDAPPENYSPVGRIVGPVQGDELWAIEPESGRRFPDETIPTCGFGLGCELSPDNQWVLAISETEGYVVFRPDGTSWRVLFDPEKPWEWPEDIWWSSGSTIEYEVYLPLPDDPRTEVWMLQRDILGVYPDPAPFYPRFLIEGA
ncbi:MAG: hypothetical protein H7175_20750, partial [Burkholderiales bacterium]|nr:hypothetical protein [Anaerolineae bacterium]